MKTNSKKTEGGKKLTREEKYKILYPLFQLWEEYRKDRKTLELSFSTQTTVFSAEGFIRWLLEEEEKIEQEYYNEAMEKGI